MKRLASLILFLTAIALQAAPEPQIGAVLDHEGAHEISVIYTEPVDVFSLSTLENYTLSIGNLSTLRLAATNQGVILRVTGLPVGANGTLSINNMTDTLGNTLPTALLEFEATSRLWAQIGDNELGFRPETVGIPENGFHLFSGGVQQSAHYDDATFMGEQISGDF